MLRVFLGAVISFVLVAAPAAAAPLSKTSARFNASRAADSICAEIVECEYAETESAIDCMRFSPRTVRCDVVYYFDDDIACVDTVQVRLERGGFKRIMYPTDADCS